MEAAAALDTIRVMKLVDDTTYARGIDLLEGIVAMLTKRTRPVNVQGGVQVHVHVDVNILI